MHLAADDAARRQWVRRRRRQEKVSKAPKRFRAIFYCIFIPVVLLFGGPFMFKIEVTIKEFTISPVSVHLAAPPPVHAPVHACIFRLFSVRSNATSTTTGCAMMADRAANRMCAWRARTVSIACLTRLGRG